MKKRIKLSESQLHNIIKESTERILNEMYPYDIEETGAGSPYDGPIATKEEIVAYKNKVIEEFIEATNKYEQTWKELAEVLPNEVINQMTNDYWFKIDNLIEDLASEASEYME